MNINTGALVLDKISSDKRLKDLNLSKEQFAEILEVYHDDLLSTLITYGSVDYPNKFRVNICLLKPRVHVLRGKYYNSTKEYKLKLSISNSIHDKISEGYKEYKG